MSKFLENVEKLIPPWICLNPYHGSIYREHHKKCGVNWAGYPGGSRCDCEELEEDDMREKIIKQIQGMQDEYPSAHPGYFDVNLAVVLIRRKC